MAENVGYDAVVQIALLSATPTGSTGRTLTQVSSSKTYRETAALQIWDPDSTITIYDNGIAVAASDIEEINYLQGCVTFTSAYTVTGPVTADYSYFAGTTVAYARAYSISASRTIHDTSRFGTGVRKRRTGLADCSGSISYIGSYLNDWSALETAFRAGTNAVIDIMPNSSTDALNHFRARVLFENFDTSAVVDGLVEDAISWQLASFSDASGVAAFRFGVPNSY